MTEALTRWPSDDATLYVLCRPLSALCDSPRSHAWEANQFHEDRGKPPVEKRKQHERWNIAKRQSKERKQATPGFQVDQGRRDRVRGMAEQGFTAAQIAEAEGVKPKSVRAMLKRMGLRAAPDKPGPQRVNMDEAVRLWNEGLTFREIAARLNTSGGHLSRRLREMGLVRKGGGT